MKILILKHLSDLVKSGMIDEAVLFIDEIDLLDELLKAEVPTREGQIHPEDPTLVSVHHKGISSPNKKAYSWHSIAGVANETERTIREKAPGFLKQLSPKHRAIMTHAINNTLKDPYKHFRLSTNDTTDKQVIRARHIKSLLLGHDSAKLDISDPNSLTLHMDRHRGFKGEKTKWNLNEGGGHKEGENYRDNSSSVYVWNPNAKKNEEGNELYPREESMGHDPGGADGTGQGVRLGSLLRLAKGIRRFAEISRSGTGLEDVLVKDTYGQENARNHEKAMNAAAESGDWDEALSRAKRIPKNWSPHEQLIGTHQVPPSHFDKVLKEAKGDPNLLYAMASNLHPDISHEQLKSLFASAPDDGLVNKNIINHPNFDKEKEIGPTAASEFWRSYERKVTPSAFAAVKSMYTGEPETVVDHRGQAGSSHKSHISQGFMSNEENHAINEKGPHFNGSDFAAPTHAVIPHLKDHAKKVQEAIMNDKNIEKKMVNGIPHIKVHRGVNGDYGQRIMDRAKFNPATHEAEKKVLTIPTAHMTSWSTSPRQAKRFAGMRMDLKGQSPKAGVTMSAWMPVKDILHSGFHHVSPTQQHAHPGEEEIIFGHPEAKTKVRTSQMRFQGPHEDEFEPAILKEKKPKEGV